MNLESLTPEEATAVHTALGTRLRHGAEHHGRRCPMTPRDGVPIEKRHEAMRQCAERYQATFGKPLAERMAELAAQYPNVVSPSWISWEGHRFTNAATPKAFKRWIAVLEAGKVGR